MTYQPFDQYGQHVPPTAEQLAEMNPTQRARYSSVAARADEVARLEAAIKETERDLAGTVEVEQRVKQASVAFPKPDFMSLWRENRSNA